MDTVVKFAFGSEDYFEERVNEIVKRFIDKGYKLVMISPVTGTVIEYDGSYGRRDSYVEYCQSFVFQK